MSVSDNTNLCKVATKSIKLKQGRTYVPGSSGSLIYRIYSQANICLTRILAATERWISSVIELQTLDQKSGLRFPIRGKICTVIFLCCQVFEIAFHGGKSTKTPSLSSSTCETFYQVLWSVYSDLLFKAEHQFSSVKMIL